MLARDLGQTSPLEFPLANVLASSRRERQRELGQFLTPQNIAVFMASLFGAKPTEIRLLDAGAGDGALTTAFVRQICANGRPPEKIAVTAFEVDPVIYPSLKQNLLACGVECARNGIEFSVEPRNEDFIKAAVALVQSDLFEGPKAPFNFAILNPPYRKINGDSQTRRLLREAGIETGNYYTGFIALAARLLEDNGEMVAICPRSFCNGPYFKPFRMRFLDLMSLRRLHSFGSRTATFQRDNVLQENVIFHAVKSPHKPDCITVSTSDENRVERVNARTTSYSDVVSPGDPDRFIHFVAAESDDAVRRKMSRFTTPLANLGLDVSTGRVVDFRAKKFLSREPQLDTVPLIYPCHFNGCFVQWPCLRAKKPDAIRETEHTGELLVPGAVYVLVKRFSSKEERRRIVACIYDPNRVAAERVGIENHLNYFHDRGRGLTMKLAKGVYAFLNSTLVDLYFRQFNGHTQVNATDLRKMPYPTSAQLNSLGQKIGDTASSQAELDAIVERELL